MTACRSLALNVAFVGLLAGVASGGMASAADARDPAEIGKQHAIIKGKNVQPTDSHIRNRLERKKRSGAGAQTGNAQPPEIAPAPGK